ncbi:MAG: hypothetical protein KA712_07900 [Myxococcales bacterium]|nr:hypothetical protein [Myxococcales bacterium]
MLQASAAAGLGSWALERPATGERHTVEVRARIVSTTPSVLRQAAIEGAGVALLPDWLVARDLQSKRLRAVLSQWVSTEVSVWALYRRELRGTPGIRAFLEALPPPLGIAGAPAARQRRRPPPSQPQKRAASKPEK